MCWTHMSYWKKEFSDKVDVAGLALVVNELLLFETSLYIEKENVREGESNIIALADWPIEPDHTGRCQLELLFLLENQKQFGQFFTF